MKVGPEVSPEQICMLGKFPMCSGTSAGEGYQVYNNCVEAPSPHPLTHAVKRDLQGLGLPSNLAR